MLSKVIALLLFGAAGAWAGQPPDHVVRPGDTLGKIAVTAGYEVRALGSYNNLADVNRIFVGQTIRFPTRGESVVALKRPAKEVSCITLGVAPWNAETDMVRRRARALQGINLLTTLTPAQRELAKAKFLMGETVTEKELVGQQIFGEMLYRSQVSGEAKHVYGKAICSPDEGGVPEVMDTYDLGDGVFLAIPKRCGNPAVFLKSVPPREEPPPPPPPQQPSPHPPPAVEVPEEPTTSPPSVAPKEAVYRWDWELVVGQEHDRTSHSNFGSGAVYGFFVDGAGAEHAFGIGGTRSSWHGRTDAGFGFDGRLWGYGPAYRFSAYEGGWDFGLKLLPWAGLTENGASGAYQSHKKYDSATLDGLTLAYNNYVRELKGERILFKHQLFVSAFKPTGAGDVGHSWEGKPISDTTELAKLDHVVNVGGRLGLYDFSEEDGAIGAKLWFAAGWFQEAPSLAETANWRFQLSDKHERVFIGFGRNYDLLNGGNIFGFGWSWDIRKTVYVHREDERRAQFIAKIEQAGGRLDKDGMVILPKGNNSPQKQFKIAPSDD